MTKITPGAGGIRPARMVAVIAVLGAAIGVTAVAAGLSGGGSPRTIEGSSDGNTLARIDPGPVLNVSGASPHGLAPGVTRQVMVTVRNSSTQEVRIKTVRIVAGNASGACQAAGNVKTTAYHANSGGATEYVVSKNRPAHIPLTITMIDSKSNQDACKGLAFPLTFNATGKKG